MEMQSTEQISYFNTFISERPRDGIDFPHARIQSAIKLNDELAEYFRDRAQVEDAYAKNMAKLSKKHYITNKLGLGTFSPLWELLQLELYRLATIHSEYALFLLEEVEAPLRSTIQRNPDYTTIHEMEERLSRIAREYDELENKIQKHKKGTKGSAKSSEWVKQKEQKILEWNKEAPQFFQKYQSIDESRLDTLKSTIHKFEAFQQTHAEQVIELTSNNMSVIANLRVDDEIAIFCASHKTSKPEIELPVETKEPHVVPEPTVVDLSVKSSVHQTVPASAIKKEKKRFFQGFGSIRRKPKSEALPDYPVEQAIQKSRSGSFVESTSLHSIHSHHTDPQESTSHEVPQPNSPISPPSLRYESSYNSSFTAPPVTSQPPLIQVDAEGYSIPPPDRAAWPGDNHIVSESLIDMDDMQSDGGSMFNSNPRIRVDIKNEVVSEEDASKSAVALTRVATLLKEKNSSAPVTPRRLRGRREMRATQLYSVVEQDQMLTNMNGNLGRMPSMPQLNSPNPLITNVPLTNPFEMGSTRENSVVSSPALSSLALSSPVVSTPVLASPVIASPVLTSPVLLAPRLDVQIQETLHLISKAGTVEKSVVWGEISIAYEGPLDSTAPICFKLNHQEIFESLDLSACISPTRDPTTFQINPHLFRPQQHQVCIKYQTKLRPDRVPLTVKPMWKCETDKSRLLIKYQKNTNLEALQNLMLVTTITGQVQSALSIPAGELVLSQSRIKWHLGQVTTDDLIKAQFTTLEQATPQPIAIRFELSDRLLTDVDVQQGQAPDLCWANVTRMTKTVKTGKYVADI